MAKAIDNSFKRLQFCNLSNREQIDIFTDLRYFYEKEHPEMVCDACDSDVLYCWHNTDKDMQHITTFETGIYCGCYALRNISTNEIITYPDR